MPYKPQVKNIKIEDLNHWYDENLDAFDADQVEMIEHLVEVAKENVRLKGYLTAIERSYIQLDNEKSKLEEENKNCVENFHAQRKLTTTWHEKADEYKVKVKTREKDAEVYIAEMEKRHKKVLQNINRGFK